MRCASCGGSVIEGVACSKCQMARSGWWWAKPMPALVGVPRRGWHRRSMEVLAAVAVTLLMLLTPSGSFLSPRGRNRSLDALMTLGLALEARYVLQEAFGDFKRLDIGRT
jgi:hypothetical protein